MIMWHNCFCLCINLLLTILSKSIRSSSSFDANFGWIMQKQRRECTTVCSQDNWCLTREEQMEERYKSNPCSRRSNLDKVCCLDQLPFNRKKTLQCCVPPNVQLVLERPNELYGDIARWCGMVTIVPFYHGQQLQYDLVQLLSLLPTGIRLV
eukprot:9341494-Ditylum_brightwellii.AAC.1